MRRIHWTVSPEYAQDIFSWVELVADTCYVDEDDEDFEDDELDDETFPVDEDDDEGIDIKS